MMIDIKDVRADLKKTIRPVEYMLKIAKERREDKKVNSYQKVKLNTEIDALETVLKTIKSELKIYGYWKDED